MCCFHLDHVWVKKKIIVICQPVSEVHVSMILYSFLLGSHWIVKGVTGSPLYILGGQWILGLIDPGDQ